MAAEKQKFTKNFMALAAIHQMIEEPTQEVKINEGKIPALVEYSLHVLSSQKRTNLKDFEDRKITYLRYLKNLQKKLPFSNFFPEMQEKQLYRLVYYELGIQSDFDIEQCKAFEKLYGE